jgi:hypothetical protein
MDGQSQEEVFWVPEGQEKTLVYQTVKKVTGVAIDPERTTYQVDLATKKEDPAYFVNSRGYGRKSNREITSRYSPEWLHQITDWGVLFRTGLALYDMEHYQDALAMFEKLGQVVAEQPVHRQAIALIWQGHMLDLLGERRKAILRYEKVAAMGLDDPEIRHDQFGIVYKPSPYAVERTRTPFTRVENQLDD